MFASIVSSLPVRAVVTTLAVTMLLLAAAALLSGAELVTIGAEGFGWGSPEPVIVAEGFGWGSAGR
ncbi:hypothetical protein [Catellatospora vulcania]|uniref:hypothetical protein n=1 Tax=Catellatospora vulcania TaxID=1460450 RepID=UPI0012D4BA45|nr:hypothetical protein [Catellatospora vulcania]